MLVHRSCLAVGRRALLPSVSAVRGIKSFDGSWSGESHTITTEDGVDLHVRLGGEQGGQPVLCMPGALGTAQTDFGPQLEGGLGKGFSVVSFDPRGYGKSREQGDRVYPLDFYHHDAKDGLAVMSALGIETFSVLGWSDGANAATILAATEPERVDNLVIWGGNSYITSEDVDLWEQMRDVSNWSDRMRSSLGAVYGLEGLQALNHRFTNAMVALLDEKEGNVSLDLIHRVVCPTLVLHGAYDQMVSGVHPKYFVKQIANARLHVFPEGKHNIHLRFADEFNSMVSDFLAEGQPAVAGTLEPEEQAAAPPAGDYVNINDIAYGFMGSKALFTALHAEIFDICAQGGADGMTVGEIEAASPAEGERLQTLLTACVSLGLLKRDLRTGCYSNSPAAAAELVSGSRHYWGDYLKHQVDRQFYTRMADLQDVMVSGDLGRGYDAWFAAEPEAAAQYTAAQHNGSLATARAMFKRLGFAGGSGEQQRTIKSFLDVGGGSGAFAIALCRASPSATATVLDLPNVVKEADRIIATEPSDIVARITTKGLSASFEWGIEDASYDVVNMSYITGSVPAEVIPDLYARAYQALEPGGMLIVHDFMVDNSQSGPRNSALWALAHVAVNPTGAGLRPALICDAMGEAGFVAPRVQEMIGELTKVIVATKPH